MHDEEFLRAFEDCTLPASDWNHRAHVRAAYLYAWRFEFPAAVERMRAGIQALNRATNTPESLERGYHETITQAFMRLVYAANLETGPHRSSEEFCAEHPDLLDKHALDAYFSPGRLRTWEAKSSFITSDRVPLPVIYQSSITIRQTTELESVQTVRELFLEYARSLDFSLCFQRFDEELRELPGSYGLPGGRLLLAQRGRDPAGCVALRRHADSLCEMKRLWVRPGYRGTGLGRKLAQVVIDEAQRCGYAGIRLDTVPTMEAAITMYRSLGFREISPYTANPVPGAIFMQLDLAAEPAVGR